MEESLDKSIHILFSQKDLTLLKQRARAQRASVAELVRQAVKKVYGTPGPKQKQASFARLAGHNELQMEDWDKVKQDLNRRYDEPHLF